MKIRFNDNKNFSEEFCNINFHLSLISYELNLLFVFYEAQSISLKSYDTQKTFVLIDNYAALFSSYTVPLYLVYIYIGNELVYFPTDYLFYVKPHKVIFGSETKLKSVQEFHHS